MAENLVNNNEDIQEEEFEELISMTSTMLDVRMKRHDKPIYFKKLDVITKGQSIKALNAVLPLGYALIYLAVVVVTKLFFIKSNGHFILFLFPSTLLLILISVVTIIPKYDENYLNYTFRYILGLKTRYRIKKGNIRFVENRAIFPNGDQLEIYCGQGRINQTSFQSDILSERDRLADARNDIDGANIISMKAYGDQHFLDQKKHLKELIQTGTPVQKEKAKKMLLDFRKNMTTEKVEKQYLLFRTVDDNERASVRKFYNRLLREGLFSPEVDFDDNKAQEILQKIIL